MSSVAAQRRSRFVRLTPQRCITLAAALLVALLFASVGDASAAPTYRHTVTASDGSAYIGNDVSGFTIGYAYRANGGPNVPTTASVDVQRIAVADDDYDEDTGGRRTRAYGYGRIVNSDVGHWSQGERCGWVRMEDLSTSKVKVSDGNVCREPSRAGAQDPADGSCPPLGTSGGLHECFLFAPGTYTRGCGAGCIDKAVIKSCSDPRVFANYKPATSTSPGSFHNAYGTETAGRGSQDYAGADSQPVTQAVPGFGSRFRSKDGRAVLIKDTTTAASGGQPNKPAWVFMKSECVGGEKLGSAPYVAPPGWHNWASLGGVLAHAPDATSRGANSLDVFVTGTDRHVHHKWWNGSSWSPFYDLGGDFSSGPSAVSWGNGRLDVFARGFDNQLWHKWYDNGWSHWEPLGGGLAGDPDVASWGSGRLDVFVRGLDGHLHHKFFNGGWSGWYDLGGAPTSDPGAVAWGPNRLDVFVRGQRNELQHLWWDGAAWRGWEDLGGVLSDAPDATSWGSGRLDVFVRGTDGSAHHKWFDGAWRPYEDLRGSPSSGPGAASWGHERIDVFSRAPDNSLQHNWYGR